MKRHVEVGRRGLEGHARREPHHQRPRLPVRALLRSIEGDAHIGATPDLEAKELWRRDADNRVRHLVDRHRATEDARVAPEATRPIRVTEHDDAACARCSCVPRSDEGPDDRLHAQHVEAIDGDSLSHDRLRLTIDEHTHRRCRIDLEGAGNRRRVRLQLLVERVCRALCGAAVTAVRHLEQGGRIVNRKWSQDQRVENAEDRGVGSDAEGERQDGGGGEGRTAPEAAQSVANILTELFPPRPCRHLMDFFHHLRRAAECSQRSVASFLRRESLFDVLGGRLLEVERADPRSAEHRRYGERTTIGGVPVRRRTNAALFDSVHLKHAYVARIARLMAPDNRSHVSISFFRCARPERVSE